MKPGQAVTWQIGPASNLMTLTGHLVSVKGKTARVRANGQVYEVLAEKLRKKRYGRIARQSCKVCGKPVGDPRCKFCSQKCAGKYRLIQTDEAVFAAIVQIKTEKQGITPTYEEIGAVAGLWREPVRRSVQRLMDAGRIWLVGSYRHKQIGVKGGRWIYEEGR